MGIHEEHVRGFPAGWSLAAKTCDSCKSAAALLFCRADSAFLCVGCDAKIHGANKLASRHERVWMCEVCEQDPASFTCKADAAALCVTCDRDIHSANPLARRHERFPVVPFYDLAASVVKSSAATLLVPDDGVLNPSAVTDDIHDDDDEDDEDDDSEEPEAATFSFLPNPNPKLTDTPDMNNANFFFSDVDHFLDFDYSASIDTRFHQFQSSGNDSVVPVQPKAPQPQMMNHSPDNCFDIDFCRSKLSSINYTAPSLSQSVSSSDVGVVPDGHSVSEISYSLGRQMNGGDLSVSSANTVNNNQGSQLCGLDREARVLRYREKRKNRKFEKTIRYASRKAYAETRPRIKGRFAKRTEVGAEVEGIYSSGSDAFMADTRYGVVPSC